MRAKTTVAALTLSFFSLPAQAEQPVLSQVSGDAALARRVALIEAQLNISPVFWDLRVPAGYSATLILHERGSSKPIKEVSLDSGATTPLFFAMVGGGGASPDQSATFGVTGKFSYTSARLDQKAGMKVSYGEADGTKTVRLVELFAQPQNPEPLPWLSKLLSPPQDSEPLLWCEIRFQER